LPAKFSRPVNQPIVQIPDRLIDRQLFGCDTIHATARCQNFQASPYNASDHDGNDDNTTRHNFSHFALPHLNASKL
jgi:hypothetical protein